MLGGDGLLSRKESMARAKAMAIKALSLDEEGSGSSCIACVCRISVGMGLAFEQSESLNDALRLSPGNAATRHYHSRSSYPAMGTFHRKHWSR